MAGQEGFEPPTSGFGVRRSNRWSYWPSCVDIQPLGASLRLFVWGVFPAKPAILAQLVSVRLLTLVSRSSIVPAFAVPTSQGDYLSLLLCLLGQWPLSRLDLRPRYSIISVIAPAPTVFPPSRIAKRCSTSMAIGLISITVMSMLSPGITMLTSSGNVMTPVTSVVLK